MIFIRRILLVATACLWAAVASAAAISDLDLGALSFEIDSFDNNPMITGTSNGIAFEFLAVDPVFVPNSTLDNNQNYNDLPQGHDDIHAGLSFSVTFAEPIRRLLVALANDNATGDGPDFGLQPVETTGITIGGATGSRLGITDINGALALFVFDAPTTVLTHTNDALTDGWDMSFFAYPVPLPPAFVLLATALSGLTLLRRQRMR